MDIGQCHEAEEKYFHENNLTNKVRNKERNE